MRDRPVLLIDGYNVFIRHFVVNPTMNKNGQHVGGAIGFLKGLTKIIDSIYPSEIVVVWEGGGSIRKRAMFSGYKNGRRPQKLNRFYEEIPDTIGNRNHQISLLISMLRTTPVNQIYVSDCEADDIIGYIANNKREGKKIVVYSSDKDYYQLMSEDVSIFTPTKKSFVSEEDVIKKFKIHPVNFCTARSFCGDVSDGIPGIKGVGYKTLARRFPELSCDSFVSVDEIINKAKSLIKTSKVKAVHNIVNNQDTAKKNWKLMYMDIRNLSAKHIDKINYSIDTFNPRSNKIELMRILSSEGIMFFDVDNLFFSLGFILK